jgi:hypothetical protein
LAVLTSKFCAIVSLSLALMKMPEPAGQIIRGNTIRYCGVEGVAGMGTQNTPVEDNLIEWCGWADAERAWEATAAKSSACGTATPFQSPLPMSRPVPFAHSMVLSSMIPYKDVPELG